MKAEQELIFVRGRDAENLICDRVQVGAAGRHRIGDPAAVGRREIGVDPTPSEKGHAVEGAVVGLLNGEQAAAHGLAHSSDLRDVDRRDIRRQRAGAESRVDLLDGGMVGGRKVLIGQCQGIVGPGAVADEQMVTGHEDETGGCVILGLTVTGNRADVVVPAPESTSRKPERRGRRTVEVIG